jgi:hypothetical protein
VQIQLYEFLEDTTDDESLYLDSKQRLVRLDHPRNVQHEGVGEIKIYILEK